MGHFEDGDPECITHSVMEGQRHKNPVNPRCFCLQRPKSDGASLLTHIIVEAAKDLGGSFKLVTLTPKTVREMTQLPKETQKNGDTQTNQRNTNEYTKYKPTLNTQNTHSAQLGCMNWSW